MGITTRKPPIKETVGAQYLCFCKKTEENEWTDMYDENVEKTEVVKSVKVTENSEVSDVYASGKVYDSDSSTSATDIEIEVIAYPVDTLAKMRGEVVNEGGLFLSGGSGERPYFAYGKVVKLKHDKVRYEWYPKCKLAENSDEINTREDKFSEQTDTIKISAYPFNEHGDIKAYVDSSAQNFPIGMTEEKFFTKPVLKTEDLSTATGE